MVDLRQIFSLTDFLRNHKGHIALLAKSGKPIVLTVKGRPSVIVQDAESYQILLDRLSETEFPPTSTRKL